MKQMKKKKWRSSLKMLCFQALDYHHHPHRAKWKLKMQIMSLAFEDDKFGWHKSVWMSILQTITMRCRAAAAAPPFPASCQGEFSRNSFAIWMCKNGCSQGLLKDMCQCHRNAKPLIRCRVQFETFANAFYFFFHSFTALFFVFSYFGISDRIKLNLELHSGPCSPGSRYRIQFLLNHREEKKFNGNCNEFRSTVRLRAFGASQKSVVRLVSSAI